MEIDELFKIEAWLHITSIRDEGGGQLRVIICIGGHKPLPRAILGMHVDEIAEMPIEYTTARYLELAWKRYFTFMVRDESTAAFRKEEKFTGHGIRIYDDSWLLGVVPELSNGLHEISGVRGGLRHYGVYSLNHIIDVLAYEAPLVQDLGEQNIGFTSG